MRTYVIDGNKFNWVESFYDEAIRVFTLPDYFGRNLDALYECLLDIDDEIEIVWENSSKSKFELAADTTQAGFFGSLVRTLEDVPGLTLTFR
jgi:RNAse (barnase) inhibitor barstar